MLVVTLAACGGGGSDGHAGKELIVGIWGGNDAETAGMEQLKAGFEELTGATLTYRVYTEYNQQIQADLIAGTAPDVFYVDVNFFPFLDSIGVLEPLDRAAVGADAFFPNLINGFVGNSGNLYALAKDFSTLALYVNTDMLNDTGFSTSDIPTSWEDFVTFLPGFQAKLDEVYGAGSVSAMTYNLEMARNLHLLSNGGVNLINADGTPNINTPAVINNFNIYTQLAATGAIHRPGDIGAGWNGEAFGTGRTAIMDEGNWVYGFLNQNFSEINFQVLNMPSYKGTVSSMLFTVGYGMNASTNHKDLALEWIKYATGVDGMATWCQAAGVLPSRQDVADKINVAADPNLQMHLQQVQHAMPWELGQYASIISDQYMNFIVEAVINGSISVEDAFRQAQEQSMLQIGG